MNAAVPVMRAVNKRLLTPEVLLLTFIRLPDCTAGRLLQRMADSRGFKLADLERYYANVRKLEAWRREHGKTA